MGTAASVATPAAGTAQIPPILANVPAAAAPEGTAANGGSGAASGIPLPPKRLFGRKKVVDDVVFIPKAHFKDAEVFKRLDLSQPLSAGPDAHVAPAEPLMPKLQMLKLQEATKDLQGRVQGSDGRIAGISEAAAKEELPPHGLKPLFIVPIELYLLTNLLELRLRRNLISVIPEEFARLRQLRVVDLAQNRLTEFPVVVCRCVLLTDLDLSENMIPSLPDNIAALVRLERLMLYGNQLYQTNDALAECRSLVELNLFNNRLIRVSPELRSLRRLQELNVSGNKLKTLPAPQEWASLRKLEASVNMMVLLPSLDTLGGLVHLQINDNLLTEWPHSVTTLTQLEAFDCAMNEIPVVPAEVGRMTSLLRLNLRHNKLRELPDTIGRLRKLSILNIGENRLTLLPPSTSRLGDLKVLMADWNRLERLPLQLTDLVLLEHASFMGNPVLMDDSNVHYKNNLKTMTALRVICVDHDGTVVFPSAKVKVTVYEDTHALSDK